VILDTSAQVCVELFINETTRLKQLNIHSLEHRRLYFDFIRGVTSYYSGLPVSTEMTFSHYDPALLEATRIRFLNTSAITLSGLTSLLNVS